MLDVCGPIPPGRLVLSASQWKFWHMMFLQRQCSIEDRQHISQQKLSRFSEQHGTQQAESQRLPSLVHTACALRKVSICNCLAQGTVSVNQAVKALAFTPLGSMLLT